jgi:hypothetical protein
MARLGTVPLTHFQKRDSGTVPKRANVSPIDKTGSRISGTRFLFLRSGVNHDFENVVLVTAKDRCMVLFFEGCQRT